MTFFFQFCSQHFFLNRKIGLKLRNQTFVFFGDTTTPNWQQGHITSTATTSSLTWQLFVDASAEILSTSLSWHKLNQVKSRVTGVEIINLDKVVGGDCKKWSAEESRTLQLWSFACQWQKQTMVWRQNFWVTGIHCLLRVQFEGTAAVLP